MTFLKLVAYRFAGRLDSVFATGPRVLLAVVLCGTNFAAHSHGQSVGGDTSLSKPTTQKFELRADQLGLVSLATLNPDALRVVGADRRVTDYRRDQSYDSSDGAWVGYVNRSMNQVLRWPTSNTGNLQIGAALERNPSYRASQMVIVPLGGQSTRRMQKPVLPPPAEPIPNPPIPNPPIPNPPIPNPVVASPQLGAGELVAELALSKLFDVVTKSRSGASARVPQSQMVRLAGLDGAGRTRYLTHDVGRPIRASSRLTRTGGDWLATPVGNGYIRLQTQQGGQLVALTAGQGGSLQLLPTTQDPRQFWRVARSQVGMSQKQASYYALESVALPGKCLTHGSSGNLLLQPVTYAPNQLWMPYSMPAAAEPFWRTVNTEVISNAILAPAKLELKNTHRNALVVALADVRNGKKFEQLRIEPKQSIEVELERDSGAMIVETVEIRSPSGVWDRQQFTTAIPPRAFYDLSVYEEHLQSIAIDATGKSPNPIEDVNYVPKSVGWIALPPGNQLPDRATIDLYPSALEARNPGAVRHLDPKQFDKPAPQNKLESILNRVQSTPRRKF
ncbi:MAG: RICIN domain-containing protein [Aureliella sp.]